MKDKFTMKGQTISGGSEKLNFGGWKEGYGYRIVDFAIYPSTSIGGASAELSAALTAGKTALSPLDVNYSDEALIATAMFNDGSSTGDVPQQHTVFDPTFIITQDLIFSGTDSSGGNPVNYQIIFESHKMTPAEEAAINFKQFAISDGS